MTSTAFQAGPHFTENNIYIIIIQYIQYFTIYMIVNLIHDIKNRFFLDENYKTILIKGVLHPRLVFGLFLHFSQKLKHTGNK